MNYNLFIMSSVREKHATAAIRPHALHPDFYPNITTEVAGEGWVYNTLV